MLYIFWKLWEQGNQGDKNFNFKIWFRGSRNFVSTLDSNRTLIWHCLICRLKISQIHLIIVGLPILGCRVPHLKEQILGNESWDFEDKLNRDQLTQMILIMISFYVWTIPLNDHSIRLNLQAFLITVLLLMSSDPFLPDKWLAGERKSTRRPISSFKLVKKNSEIICLA